MVNFKTAVINHRQSNKEFNLNFIEKGSIYKFKNSDIAKFVKFRKRNYGESFQIIPKTPEFLLKDPDGWHPWIFLKRYQISSKKTKKVFLGVRSHFEPNKKGYLFKQLSHLDKNPLHVLEFVNCSIDKEGVYMKNTPIEQTIEQKDMVSLLQDNTIFSCIDEDIDHIFEKLNELDETYT